jgi:hypothetical protein
MIARLARDNLVDPGHLLGEDLPRIDRAWRRDVLIVAILSTSTALQILLEVAIEVLVRPDVEDLHHIPSCVELIGQE